jgi:hypothetical protein
MSDQESKETENNQFDDFPQSYEEKDHKETENVEEEMYIPHDYVDKPH